MIYRYLTALSTYRNNLMGKSPDWASNNVSLFYEKTVVFKTTHERVLCNVLVVCKGALHTLVIYILYVY